MFRISQSVRQDTLNVPRFLHILTTSNNYIVDIQRLSSTAGYGSLTRSVSNSAGIPPYKQTKLIYHCIIHLIRNRADILGMTA